MSTDGMSIIVVEIDGHVAGVIGIRDGLRPEATDTVAALHTQGIATAMLTGDNILTGHAIATQAGIATVHAEQLPADKADHIRRLAEHAPTAMIGDGINEPRHWRAGPRDRRGRRDRNGLRAARARRSQFPALTGPRQRVGPDGFP